MFAKIQKRIKTVRFGVEPCLVFVTLVVVAACGYNDKLPSSTNENSEDAIDLSFGKPRPGFLNRTLKSLTTPAYDSAQAPKVSLIDDHLVIAGSPLKSLVSADEGVSFTEVTPLQDIVQAEQAYILPDQHFWSINGRQILRSRTPAKNSDGSRQSLQFASLNFPESFGSLHKVLGFSKTQLFLEFTGDRFVVINYVSDDSPNNGELQASNLSLLPAFVSIQAPNLAAGALPENRGYWILRGPYMASLLRSDADPLKPFTWQLYDNHIEITDSKPLTHMALKPILIEGEWSASGRVFGITADSLLKSALPAEITPNFAKHIKPISVRACEVCHDSSTALDTEERWLAHRDSIVDRISRPKDSPGRMPPQGAKGFTPDDRDLILEFLK